MGTTVGYFKHRITNAAQIIVCILLDTAIFSCWMGLAWVSQAISDFMSSHGVNESFALAFKWASSASTLVLTLSYIWRDISAALKDLGGGK